MTTSITDLTETQHAPVEENNNQLVQDIINEIQQQEASAVNVPEQIEQQVKRQIDPQVVTPQKPVISSKTNIKDIIINNIKNPLIVSAIFLILSLSITNNTILDYLPKLADLSGNMTLLGVLLKSIIAGALYYVISRFV